MNEAYSILDIKITEKKNMYGEIFEVDSLSVNELEMYIECLILFEDKKYWVSTIEHIVSVKRERQIYKVKKVLKK